MNFVIEGSRPSGGLVLIGLGLGLPVVQMIVSFVAVNAVVIFSS